MSIFISVWLVLWAVAHYVTRKELPKAFDMVRSLGIPVWPVAIVFFFFSLVVHPILLPWFLKDELKGK